MSRSNSSPSRSAEQRGQEQSNRCLSFRLGCASRLFGFCPAEQGEQCRCARRRGRPARSSWHLPRLQSGERVRLLCLRCEVRLLQSLRSAARCVPRHARPLKPHSPAAFYSVRHGRVADCNLPHPPPATPKRLYVARAAGIQTLAPAYTLRSGMGLYNLARDTVRASSRPIPVDSSHGTEATLAGVGVAARKAGIPNGSAPAALE